MRQYEQNVPVRSYKMVPAIFWALIHNFHLPSPLTFAPPTMNTVRALSDIKAMGEDWAWGWGWGG